jgi:protein SHQ1
MQCFYQILSPDVEEEELELTDDERERLISLPQKLDLAFDKELSQSVYFGLVDILFAFLYDLRTTDGEHTSESGW